MVGKGAYMTLDAAAAGYRRRSGDLPVLEGLNFSLEAGKLVVLAGLNGSGKSTLLRSLAGLQPLLKGKIMVEGKNMAHMDRQELAKKIAVVLTERPSGFNLRVRDVVAAGQMPYTGMFNKLNKQQSDAVEDAARRCGVSGYMQLPLHELSDGMFQKTMIAKAVAQQTDVLLLDEPAAFLDYASRHQLFSLLKDLAVRDRKCVLISSHDLDLALQYCDNILFVSSGQARLLNPEDALQDEAFIQMTGGYLRR